VIVAALAEARQGGARLDAACQVLGLSARTIQRWKRAPEADDRRCGPRHRPGNALSVGERAQVVSLLTSREYGHLSPKQLVPRLADEGRYLASESTIYRVRRRLDGRPRARPQLHHAPQRGATLHRATRANQVWSWDITSLPTVIRGRFLRLYLVVDIWSRRIMGWEIHEIESAERAAHFIQAVCARSGVDPAGLILHSDNGQPMTGHTMVSMLQWLGIVPSLSRPHVCNDNPYSEALFRTLKYTPAYPRWPFVDRAAADAWVARFVAWYNSEHRHSGLRFVTPDQRHAGDDLAILANRRGLYERARRRTPARWSGSTRNWSPVDTVVLNPAPQTTTTAINSEDTRQLP
jgi:putative transposase